MDREESNGSDPLPIVLPYAGDDSLELVRASMLDRYLAWFPAVAQQDAQR